MRPLRELRVRNYKSLRDVTVALGPVNVLVGPNAAGKSNLLDVIQFLGDSVRSDLRPALERRGGYERVRFRGVTKGGVSIGVRAVVTRYSSSSAPDEYTLEFSERRTSHGSSSLLREEQFRFKRRKGPGRRITIRGSEIKISDQEPGQENDDKELERLPGLRRDSLGLATLPRLSDVEGGEEVRTVAELFSSFRVFDVNVEEARRPSPLRPGPLFPDASNLASFLYWLAQNDDAFTDFAQDARALVPGLAAIEFEERGGSTGGTAVVLAENGLRGRTELAEASYGTIRALALLALLYDPDPPMLTCIEEFDHGLHPYAFDLLVERVRETAERTQILMATHSPTLVNRLKPEELIVCERGLDGASRIPATDAASVRAMEDALDGQFRLGELWFSGTLGGVPD